MMGRRFRAIPWATRATRVAGGSRNGSLQCRSLSKRVCSPVAGQECVVWNPALSIPTKEFEFSDPEIARVKAAIETWDSYGVSPGRGWPKPLTDALFSLDLQR